ncbi:MAG: cytochrome c oxidase subunit 3 [Alphaproteobacteria bacterium]|nr:cytochrome c oxidase subunit 3 [Alphaproteobacteria bacterium]
MGNNHKVGHKYHLVDPSPLPLITSASLFILAIGAVLFMHEYKLGTPTLMLGLAGVLYSMFAWWKDVIKEGREDKAHTSVVRQGLSLGMLLFIISEVMFFFAFFWSFFDASIFPADILDGGVWPEKKGVWPPEGIKTLDPWNIPFLNTLILLLSGTTVTWAHYSLIENKQKDLVKALTITVALGAIFTTLQVYEYYHAEFQWKDGVFASNFYMATGFHGFHVLVGTIFLFICLLRARAGHFQKGYGHLGFEFAAWYWHFVDVVWLFLFVFVYVWGK